MAEHAIELDNLYENIAKDEVTEFEEPDEKKEAGITKPIDALLDANFMSQFFMKKLRNIINFQYINRVTIKKHKLSIDDWRYHIVIEYNISFISKRKNNLKNVFFDETVFCTAHSDEPRKNIDILKFLRSNGFSRGPFAVPTPLFISKIFKGSFYIGAKGHDLYYFIKSKNRKRIEKIVAQIAGWLTKLHKLKIENLVLFNKNIKEKSRISEKTISLAEVVPGVKNILKVIYDRFPQFGDFYNESLKEFIAKEDMFFKNKKKRWIIHGDAHPKNFIKADNDSIVAIDFADFCVSDFARDLGCFLQQFEYMSNRKIGDNAWIENVNNLFLETYMKKSSIHYDNSLKDRIENYYRWTALRSATQYLFSDKPQIREAERLLNQIQEGKIVLL